jgi:16S rRNA processing protein RimM
LEFLEVARVIKPHGLGGEVGVLMHWADSGALSLVKLVRLQLADGTTVEREIARVRAAGRGFLVKFIGVDDCNAAEALRGATLWVGRDVLPAVGPGEVYLSDLIGKQVLGPDGVLVGTVVEIASYPSVDALVIERENGSRVEQPLVEDWVEPLDGVAANVVLRSLDGLLG